MPLKNYKTRCPVESSISRVQSMLVSHGATNLMLEYETGTGRIASLAFAIDLGGSRMAFRLPLRWEACKAAMIEDGVARAKSSDDYCYRVAWAIMRDWVDVQMAILETQMVTLPQIFLPYAVTRSGQTLYEQVAQNPGLLLGEG